MIVGALSFYLAKTDLDQKKVAAMHAEREKLRAAKQADASSQPL
jgi:hypothetical protein